MIDQDSRYENIETIRVRTAQGREIAYLRRRFLPRGEHFATLGEVVVAAGDRLDQITTRSLGNPEQFWRLCDANNAMNPFALVSEVGLRIRIPVPQVQSI